jgi:hypothetical protein
MHRPILLLFLGLSLLAASYVELRLLKQSQWLIGDLGDGDRLLG